MSQAVPKTPPAAPYRLAAAGAMGHALRGRMHALATACAATSASDAGIAGRRASLFASDLLQRHRWMRAGETRPERIFAAPGTLTTVHAPHQHWHLAYAPRVTLRLAASDREIQPTAQPIVTGPIRERTVVREVPRFMSTLVERVLRHCERIDTLEMVERATPATLRHERSDPVRVDARIAAAAVPQGRVQRVLRTPNATARAEAMTRGAASVPQSTVPPMPRSAPTHQPASSRTPAHINIEQLADRVVHAIDRRLVAQRERFGRA